MQVILDSPFARPGSAPIGGGKKGEFRDWTRLDADQYAQGDGKSVNRGLLVLDQGGKRQLACDTPDSLRDENTYLERVFYKKTTTLTLLDETLTDLLKLTQRTGT